MDWRPIETAPKDGEPVIVGCVDTGFVTMARLVQDDDRWYELNNDPTDYWGSEIYPTHWMPKPPAPSPDMVE